ncbi:MAG: FAD/NAD(P)-binding protein [candidate division WOR-3 bacterium]|nr:FAD/NAD(P)-binding protein [candidate division WOR-3 bacterium]
MNQNYYLPEPMRIVRRYDLSKDVRFFQVRALEMERALKMQYLPGQFMIISLPGVGEAPFSISSSPSRPGLLEFGIRRIGVVTNELFKLKENAMIGVRGPYGNGFPIEKIEKHDVIIVVGGLSVIPLRSLLLYVLDNRDRYGQVTFMYGGRKPEDMLFLRELLELRDRDDLNCLLAVEKDPDGKWPCEIGMVTSLFSRLKKIDAENTYALVCGPPVMYKFVIDELLKLNIQKHQILMTLERRMKCGIGKCGHCAIGSIYTCLDGPVFSYWDVLHMKDLI